MSRCIIDTETGELLGELDKGDRIVKKKSVEYLESTEKVEIISSNRQERFSKLYYSINDILQEEFTTVNDYKLYMTLMRYVRYDSCILAYDNGKELKQKDIIELSKIPSSTCRRTIQKFIDIELLKKGESVFYCNPYVFCKGNRVYKSVIKKFKDSKYNLRNIRVLTNDIEK